MSKETKVQTVDFEEVETLKEEVAEAIADDEKKEAKKQTTKEPMKDRAKRFGKNAIKVGAGVVSGFALAVLAGVVMNKNDKDYDEYLLEKYGDEDAEDEAPVEE